MYIHTAEELLRKNNVGEYIIAIIGRRTTERFKFLFGHNGKLFNFILFHGLLKVREQ